MIKSLSNFIRSIEEFIRRQQTDSLELFLIICGMFTGAWLISPVPIFSSAIETYKPMTLLMRQQAWGAIIAAISAAHLIGIGMRSRRLRRATLFIKSLFWVFFLILFIAGDYARIGAPLFAALIIGSGWAFVKLGARENE